MFSGAPEKSRTPNLQIRSLLKQLLSCTIRYYIARQHNVFLMIRKYIILSMYLNFDLICFHIASKTFYAKAN